MKKLITYAIAGGAIYYFWNKYNETKNKQVSKLKN